MQCTMSPGSCGHAQLAVLPDSLLEQNSGPWREFVAAGTLGMPIVLSVELLLIELEDLR